MLVQANSYVVGSEGVTVTNGNDFFGLRGGAGVLSIIKEIRVFQTNVTDLEMLAIVIARGSALTDYPNDTNSPASARTGHSNPGTNMGSIDWNYFTGWNLLQDMIWLPTPQLQLILKPADELSLSLANSPAASTTIGFTISWDEVAST